MQHVSIIDWAFRVCSQNEAHSQDWHCQIGKIIVGGKTIDPKVFIKRKRNVEKNTGVWN